ncbi:sugar-binding transcriptional regulator [Clostridiales bacterium COT073_COT-073]|nr:sugar-binding transcriptional regulator [Clostridiales bacterium COT073_COT-073]
MSKSEEQRLLIDVAIMYYLENKTQSEIAKSLYLSRPKVSRLLKKARDTKVVEITIHDGDVPYHQLCRWMKESFKVEKVIITKSYDDEERTIRECGKAAAEELSRVLSDDVVVGISWGRNIKAMAKYVGKSKYRDIKVVELFGDIHSSSESNDVRHAGLLLAQNLGAELYALHCPLYINDDKAREAIKNTAVVKNTLNMIQKCDVIVSGIGHIGNATSLAIWDNYIDPDIQSQIIKANGVGFLCAHFFDHNGEFLDLPINREVIGIDIESIKSKKNILVAGGRHKTRAILALLQAGYVNTLVTDEINAEKILSYVRD